MPTSREFVKWVVIFCVFVGLGSIGVAVISETNRADNRVVGTCAICGKPILHKQGFELRGFDREFVCDPGITTDMTYRESAMVHASCKGDIKKLPIRVTRDREGYVIFVDTSLPTHH